MANSLNKRLRAGWHAFRTGQVSTMTTSTNEEEIRALTPEEVAEARDFFPLQKFFIFGHARSGTTMLVRLIRLHPQVHCNYQAHFFTRPPLLHSLVANSEVRKWLASRSNRWNRGQDMAPVVLRAAADFILEREARRVGKVIVGDKSPSNLMHGEAVHRMRSIYPDARLIYIIRDGRDVVLSHRIQSFIEFPEHLTQEDRRILSDFARNPAPYLSGEKSLFTEKWLKREAENWSRNVRETDASGKELVGGQYISLRYEDLLEHSWEEMNRLWFFLGASPGDAALATELEAEMQRNPDAEYQHQKAGELAQALQKGKRGSWREMFTARDRQTFDEIAGPTLETWGYGESVPPT